MYIWVAIDVNEQVIKLREVAENYIKEHGLSSTTFSLPFHISLKISFQVPDDKIEEVVSDICDFYKSLKPFQIKIKGIEKSGQIVWITMQDSYELADIHKKLDEMLLEKYGVAQHGFDKDFIFHTSVLMLNNEEEIARAYDAIKGTNIPKTLRAERFIIGSSNLGLAGTYSVVEEIDLNNIDKRHINTE